MSMLSPCTLLSLAPGKFSPAALQLRTKQPEASSPVVAFPLAAPRYNKVSGAPRLVCHAQPHEYKILPTALVHPKSGRYGDWKINDDEERITLEFDVGEETKEDNLLVTTTEDHALLVIKYKGDGKDNSLATKLDARLLMPPGYDDKKVMRAEILPNGWLEIVIAKPKPPANIPVTKKKKDETPPPAPGAL
ncbi:unnamed protein product [Urochloa humidicola]